ncbi:MAG: hypothetical protein JWQ38_1660 [Flavipsychrobacter sp.]|nr:hypothetical protein [Flavipsychrobacter sp.]
MSRLILGITQQQVHGLNFTCEMNFPENYLSPFVSQHSK